MTKYYGRSISDTEWIPLNAKTLAEAKAEITTMRFETDTLYVGRSLKVGLDTDIISKVAKRNCMKYWTNY